MLEQFQEWALRQVSEVKQAPGAIVALLALGFAIGWFFAQQFYAERITFLELLVEKSGTPPPAVFVWPTRAVWAGAALAILVAIVAARGARRDRRQSATSLARVDEAQADRQQLTVERDAAAAALKDKKHEYAIRTLQRHSHLRLHDGTRPNLSIRYYAYGHDYDLAKLIEELFNKHVQWNVKLDPQNGPALEPEKDFKVVFDVGMTLEFYGDLVHAFNEGNLLGVAVGWRRMTPREDVQNLIVEVLPSTNSAPKDKTNG